MCHCVYLSTTGESNLALHDTERITFMPLDQGEPEKATCLLEFPHAWYVSWMGGCSCGLRHLESTEMWFGEPEDWCPEDEEDIDNTRHLYRVLLGLVRAGHAVDCLDVWSGTEPDDVIVLDVALEEIPETHFRLFHNHRFRFVSPATNRSEALSVAAHRRTVRHRL